MPTALASPIVFTLGGFLAGAVAAFIVGISKTGLPGSSLAAIPLIALVVDGRLIPGATLPLLIVADLFALAWYRHHARWDVLRGLTPGLGLGFLAGITFFIVVGSATRPLEMGIGLIVLGVAVMQLWRMFSESPPTFSRLAAGAYGTGGGFTTFVANAAGPIINTHLASLRLPKLQLLGTSAWLYFALNVSKIPFYVALGVWSEGGSFFTADSMVWDLALVPGVVGGVLVGRIVAARIPQRAFLLAVLILSAAGALVLVF